LQMLFEVHGLVLALHHDARFLRLPGAIDRARTAFERIVAQYATSSGLAASPAARPGALAPKPPRKPARR